LNKLKTAHRGLPFSSTPAAREPLATLTAPDAAAFSSLSCEKFPASCVRFLWLNGYTLSPRSFATCFAKLSALHSVLPFTFDTFNQKQAGTSPSSKFFSIQGSQPLS